MITKKLLSKNSFMDDNGFEFSVEYFITKTSAVFNDSVCPYGFTIEKPMLNGDSDVYSAEACFKKEDNAILLLQALSEYQVTPLSAEESIDTLMDLCKFNY